MPTRLALLLMALLLAASGCSKSSGGEQPSPEGSAAPGRSWHELSSPEGRFSVLMLSGEKQESSQAKKPEGTVETVSYFAATPEGRAYSVSYSDYPEAIWKAKSPEQMLDTTRDGAVGQKGTLVSEKKTALGTATGRELLIAGKDEPFTVRVRIAMVDGRLYLLQAFSGGSVHNVADPDADRFFDSFRLLPK